MSRPTVVDVHAHVIVPGLGAEVRRDAGKQIVAFGSQEIRSAVREFVSIDRILEEQDRAGVDKVVLSPWVALLGHERARQNEGLAALVSDRVACLGTVSLDAPDEVGAVMRDGRLSGVEVAASDDGEYLGARRFRPFWAAAEESGAVVLIHPTTRGFRDPVFDQHYLWNTLGNPFETTITAAHMILEGVLDDHPGLKVILAHGGGAVTALRGRLAHHQAFAEPGRDVVGALRRFYYDSVVFDPTVLRALVEFVGPERVLLGSDYPFDMGDDRPADVPGLRVYLPPTKRRFSAVTHESSCNNGPCAWYENGGRGVTSTTPAQWQERLDDYERAGFTHVALHNVGIEQREFIKFATRFL